MPLVRHFNFWNCEDVSSLYSLSFRLQWKFWLPPRSLAFLPINQDMKPGIALRSLHSFIGVPDIFQITQRPSLYFLARASHLYGSFSRRRILPSVMQTMNNEIAAGPEGLQNFLGSRENKFCRSVTRRPNWGRWSTIIVEKWMGIFTWSQ